MTDFGYLNPKANLEDDEGKNMKIVLSCPKCGYKPKPDKKMSNENWKVYDMICSKCGERLKFEYK